MASTDEQLAELRAEVNALRMRVAALEAFPEELVNAFNELAPQAQATPGVSGQVDASFLGGESTAGGTGGGTRPAPISPISEGSS